MTSNISPESQKHFKTSVLLNKKFQERFLNSIQAILIQEEDWRSKTQFPEADSIGFEDALLKYLAVPSEHLLKTSPQAQERLVDLHDDIIDAANRYLVQLNWYRAQPHLGTICNRMQKQVMQHMQVDLTPYSQDELLQARVHNILCETIEALEQIRELFSEETKQNRRTTGGYSSHVIWNADAERYHEMDYQDFLYEMENIFLEIHHWPLGLYPLIPEDHALIQDKAKADEHFLMRLSHIESGHIEIFLPGKKLSGRDQHLSAKLSNEQREIVAKKTSNARIANTLLNAKGGEKSEELPKADVLTFPRPK